MRTIAIIGTDWTGPDPNWVRQPFLDGGRLRFDRVQLEDWKNVFYELCDLARIPCLAIGIRGAYSDYDVNWRAPALDAYRTASPQPTLCPWFDTVGLPDMVNAPGRGDFKFDFANDEHIAIGWEKYARVFFDAFAGCRLERSPRGKVLIPWWGIASDNGHGFTNQRDAQRLLNYVDEQIAALGLHGADHIVDTTWLELCPELQVYGVHDWFNPWKTPPSAYSIRTHNGVTVGLTVPSFYRIINPEGNVDVLEHALSAMEMHQPRPDYVVIESGTNFSEGAELMRDAAGNIAKLDAVRRFVELNSEGDPMDAVTKQPLLDWVLFESLLPGVKPNTFALRWNEAKGEPDPNSDRVFSLQPDGSIQTRALDQIGLWESSCAVADGDRELTFVTENTEKTQRAMKVFGLKRGL